MPSFLKVADPSVQQYIFDHAHEDEKLLVLAHPEILGVKSSVIASQIAGRRKAKSKLPLWFNTKGVIYPPSLNLEQSSSQATAQFKASLFKGQAAVDLTGGFGVDSYYLSEVFQNFSYVESNQEIFQIAKYNHLLLGANNINHHLLTAGDFLKQSHDDLDLIFIDPSRRNKQQKVFKLADCEPNATALLPELFRKSKSIMIKASPLLDIQQALRELNHVTRIIVVAVENECKELLFLLDQQSASIPPTIEAVDLAGTGIILTSFQFEIEEEKNAVANFSAPLQYLYEPSVSILKAGAFKTITQRYPVFKLHINSHLFTSEDLYEDFPGRIFQILKQVKLDKKLKDEFSNGYANVLVRNYPLSVEEIKKKSGLKEGGENYLIATQSEKGKHLFIVKRIR